jgi:hypothetical protein
MNKKINIGDIRSNLKLLQVIPNKNKDHTQFVCECLLCGKEAIIRRNKFGRQKSCGCIRFITGEKNHLFQGYKEINMGKWNTYKNNARKRNIDFNITIEYAYEVYERQNKKCAVSGEPISFWQNATIRKSTASLDRIDNKKGYVYGNIQWVHKKINQIKMDMTLDEFFMWCDKVNNNRGNVCES